MKFRVLAGSHWLKPTGARKPIRYRKGDVVESERDLCAIFNGPPILAGKDGTSPDPRKYERVPDDTPASTPKEV